MPPDRAELFELFRRLATEIVERDFPHLSESTVIGDLGVDSLGMLEIIGALERDLKVQIPDEALSSVQTVGDLLNVVEKRGPRRE